MGKPFRMLLFFDLCVDWILEALAVLIKILYGCCEKYWQYDHTGFYTIARPILLDVSSVIFSGTGLFLQAL